MLSFLMGVFCRVELTRSLGNLTFWIVFQSSCTISHSHWQYMIVLISPHLHQHLLLSFIKAMAPHSSTLAWRIPWMEEPGGLQSMGSLRVRHDWATSLHFSLSCIGEGGGNPLQGSCLESPRDGGAWWAAICGVAQSWTRLKWLSSSRPLLLGAKILQDALGTG